MPRRLRHTAGASSDLDEARRWLPTQLRSAAAARQPLAAIRADILRLAVGEHWGVRELPCTGDYRAPDRVIPDTGRPDTAADVLVLRVFGPGESRAQIRSGT
jgi:hypothetical protein